MYPYSVTYTTRNAVAITYYTFEFLTMFKTFYITTHTATVVYAQ